MKRLAAILGLLVVVLGVLCAPVIIGARFADRPMTLYLRLGVALGALLLLIVIAKAIVRPLPRRVVLSLDLTEDLPEVAADWPMSKLPGKGAAITLLDVVRGLEIASKDKRVIGLYAKIAPGVAGAAKVAEVRDAVIAFRAAGKPTLAFSETFGEFASSAGSYHLATAFDEIVMQPSGDVGLTGAIAEAPFVRGALDKAGIKTQMDHRYEYKNAMNMFTEKKYTKPHREAASRILESQFEIVAADVAEARKMTPKSVRAAIDRGPFLGEEAVDEGLVDRLAYRDQVIDRMKERVGKGVEILDFAKWWKVAGKRSKGATVALVYGTGAVITGKSRFVPPFGQSMGSDTVAAAIRHARKDKSVKAIVFRVDSPGGSYVASDTIWREVVRAKADGKPVIATMGNVAGSGGYFVAMAADKIVAQPGTLTGSIGVLGGKQVLGALKERFGLTTDSLRIGAAAGQFSTNAEYNPAEWSRLQAWLDRVYDDFTAKAADGRGMSQKALQALAKGRVWTGVDAKERGLVDELGGFPAALRLAREAANIKPDAPIKLKLFPKKKSLVASIRSGSPAAAIMALFGVGRIDLGPLTGLASPYLNAVRSLVVGEVSMPPEFWPGQDQTMG